MAKQNKKYRVEVAFQGEHYITVRAKTSRGAIAKAVKIAGGKTIGMKNIRRDWCDVMELEN